MGGVSSVHLLSLKYGPHRFFFFFFFFFFSLQSQTFFFFFLVVSNYQNDVFGSFRNSSEGGTGVSIKYRGLSHLISLFFLFD